MSAGNRTSYRTSLELCKPCGGRGYIERDELTNYHKGEYDVIRSQCGYCEGQGRVILEETSTYRPLTDFERKTEARY